MFQRKRPRFRRGTHVNTSAHVELPRSWIAYVSPREPDAGFTANPQTCARKRHYSSLRAAERGLSSARQRLRQRQQPLAAAALQIYTCRVCNLYALGRVSDQPVPVVDPIPAAAFLPGPDLVPDPREASSQQRYRVFYYPITHGWVIVDITEPLCPGTPWFVRGYGTKAEAESDASLWNAAGAAQEA